MCGIEVIVLKDTSALRAQCSHNGRMQIYFDVFAPVLHYAIEAL